MKRLEATELRTIEAGDLFQETTKTFYLAGSTKENPTQTLKLTFKGFFLTKIEYDYDGEENDPKNDRDITLDLAAIFKAVFSWSKFF